MNDPKYEIRDGRLWHKEGRYFLPADEPTMMLRGKDPDAIRAIREYINGCLLSGGDPYAIVHVHSATERLHTFIKWQAEHLDRVRRGCHECP